MKIKIGNKTYDVQIAETEDEKESGLQGVHYLPEDEGMLFVYEEPEEEISFWMQDTPLALDVIFINDDYEVTSVHKGEPNSETPMTGENVKFVLELNEESGVSIGDELEFIDDKESKSKMMVLDQDGGVQIHLEGGERIFSRTSTKVLLKKANEAYKVKDNPDKYDKKCMSLGKYIFKELNAQDNRSPEYVKE